jgi:iron complex transport system substrate-binding protein
MRVCSLLPSATEIISQLGLIDSLVGVSDECRWPPEVVGKPVVSASRIDSTHLSSAEIDAVVRESVSDGRSLYTIDSELVEELSPELIVTQDLCSVCAVSSGDLASACPLDVEVLSLDPHTLGDIADSVRLLGSRLGVPERADAIADGMLLTIEDAAASVEGLPRRRVFFAEWVEPPFCAGHWLPEMIEIAGGTDVLGRAGQPSYPTTWEQVLSLEPELVVFGPCGFGVDEAAARAAEVRLPCPSVAVDGDAYYSRPAPRVAEGIRQLAHLFHPEAAPDPGLPAVRIAELTPAVASDIPAAPPKK